MTWIDNIRNKPQEQKIRIIWTAVIIVAVILIAVWIITARFNKHVSPDMTVFQTIKQGFSDIKDSYKKWQTLIYLIVVIPNAAEGSLTKIWNKTF